MYSEIFVENIKCYGCRNTVIKEVENLEMVERVDVEIETGKVSLVYNGGDETLSRVKSRLERKGYPLKGQNNLKRTTQSYLSCAMGRLDGPTRYQVKNFDYTED